MDYKEACDILGVSEDAGRGEIERRYGVLLKRRKMAQAENDTQVLEEVDIEKVTYAYNFLMGYVEPVKDEVPSKAAPILKKAGIDEKKARNFWDYHKFHILGGIALLIVLIFSLRSCLTAEKPDFNLAYIGDIYFLDSEVVKENIKNAVPDIKVPGIDGAILSEDADAQMDYAMRTKVTVLLTVADVDLFLVDKEVFRLYAELGAFASLDEYVSDLGVDKEKYKDFVLTPESETAEGLYGIDVSNSSLLKNSKIHGESLVAAISVRSKKADLAAKLIKALLAE